MLSDKLKVLTKANHQLAEKQLMLKLRAMEDLEDYAILLSLFYTYYGSLEILIGKYLDKTFLPDHLLRNKTELLAADLLILKMPLPVLGKKNITPAIENNFSSIGALYVIEGSTLGGRIVSSIIQKQFDLPRKEGISFFSGYEENTDTMWQVFKQSLNNMKLARDKENSIIQSANETFVKLNEWLISGH